MNNYFRKRPKGPPLSPVTAARQGRISQLAFAVLGRDEALLFLNSDNATLGARPIDLAVESEEGCVSVEAELNRLKS